MSENRGAARLFRPRGIPVALLRAAIAAGRFAGAGDLVALEFARVLRRKLVAVELARDAEAHDAVLERTVLDGHVGHFKLARAETFEGAGELAVLHGEHDRALGGLAAVAALLGPFPSAVRRSVRRKRDDRGET